MKLKISITVFLFINSLIFSQTITNGPVYKNDRNSNVNRFIQGDDNSFYCYRVRSQGPGTDLVLEKYEKSTLTLIYSKELDLAGENKTKIVDILYMQGKVFVFKKLYKDKEDKMNLFYQTISSDGNILDTLKEIISVNKTNPSLINFDIIPNAKDTKILIEVQYKNGAKAELKTEFVLMDMVTEKKLWTKKVDEKTFNNELDPNTDDLKNAAGIGFRGSILDIEDNFYFGYMTPSKTWTAKKPQFKLSLGIVNKNDTMAKKIDLDFDDGYFVESVYVSKISDHEILIGGYVRDVQASKCKVGVYSFRVDLNDDQIKSKAVKFFDKDLLKKIDFNTYNFGTKSFKLDNVFYIDNSVYFIGQQYSDSRSLFSSGLGFSAGGLIGISGAEWNFKYTDVIIAKLNDKGEFEWIKNIPMNQDVKCEHRKLIFRQYIAYSTRNNIYILNNDHASNFYLYQKPNLTSSSLYPSASINGKVLICNTLNLNSLEIKRSIIMNDKDFNFAPIQERDYPFYPPNNCEIYVPGQNNEIFIHTKDGSKDRFSKIKFE